MEEKLSIETKVIDGVKQTFYKGKRHSFDDKPAVDGPDMKIWYKHGLKHRIGGPAMVYRDNSKYYYYEGVKTGGSLPEHLLYLETKDIIVEEVKSDKWYKRILKYIGL